MFLLGESHGQRSLVGYSPWGSQRVGHDWATELMLSFFNQISWTRSCANWKKSAYFNAFFILTIQECFLQPSRVALVLKNLPANAGDLGDTGQSLGRCPGGGHGNPLQCSCLENPTDRRAGWATAHMIVKSRTQLKWLGTDTHTHRPPRRIFPSQECLFINAFFKI